MTLNRRSFGRHLAAGVSAGIGAGLGLGTTAAQAHDRDGPRGEEGGMRAAKFFTMTNGAAGNELLVIGADPDGDLALLARYRTFGLGSGAGLGSQGSVTLSEDGRHLFVVNAGSHSVSTFALHAGALTLVSVQDSGGLHPISVAERDEIVYVLHDGGSGNIAGFHEQDGTLRPIDGSVRPLSAAGGTGPAQIGFDADGAVLIVTEKTTRRILTYALGRGGRAGAPRVTASAGLTPFGFAVDRRNRLFVSEAGASTLSSYRLGDAADDTPQVVSAAVANGQAAACWAAAAPNARFVYTGNAGTSTVSQYAVDRRGALSLVAGAAASTQNGGAGDLAIAGHGRTLGILAPRTASIYSYAVAADGSLSPSGTVTGLDAGVVGLAAN